MANLYNYLVKIIVFFFLIMYHCVVKIAESKLRFMIREKKKIFLD